MFNLQCNGDPHLSFFCGVMFSDTYPRCFAALLANASARFIFWFQRNWKDRTYCSSRAASLVPNPSWVLNSLGTYFFRRRHTWSSNCVPVSFRLPFTLIILLTCIFTWTTLRNGRLFFPHSDRQDLAPTLCTHRSVHIRCNFKPTSTCPTPPNPYQLMGVEARTKKHWRRKHATMPS